MRSRFFAHDSSGTRRVRANFVPYLHDGITRVYREITGITPGI